MAHFKKGEAEKNFIHEGVGRVKRNSRKKGAPPGVGMVALGSHHHPQQAPRESRDTEPSKDWLFFTPALLLGRSGKATDDFHSANLYLGSYLQGLALFLLPSKEELPNFLSKCSLQNGTHRSLSFQSFSFWDGIFMKIGFLKTLLLFIKVELKEI